MATFTTVDNITAKEDVWDIVDAITPTDFNFQSNVKKEKIHDTLYRWFEKKLRNVQVNAATEGADATSATLTNKVERSNVTQILEKTVQIADTLEAVDNYGRASTMADELADALYEVKRDLEHAYIGTAQTSVSGLTRKMAGVQAMIDASMIISTGGANTALSEDNLLDAIQKTWAEGGNPNTVLVTGDDAETIANFAKAAGRYRTFDSGSKGESRIANIVDVYVAPWNGPQAIQTNRFLKAGDSLVLNFDNFKQLVLRDWKKVPLAKTGDSEKVQVIGEFSLRHKNFFDAAMIRRQA